MGVCPEVLNGSVQDETKCNIYIYIAYSYLYRYIFVIHDILLFLCKLTINIRYMIFCSHIPYQYCHKKNTIPWQADRICLQHDTSNSYPPQNTPGLSPPKTKQNAPQAATHTVTGIMRAVKRLRKAPWDLPVEDSHLVKRWFFVRIKQLNRYPVTMDTHDRH